MVGELSGITSGLSTEEKNRALSIMGSIMEGMATKEQLGVLQSYYRRDPEFFIASQLNAIMFHPSFNDPEMIVDNWHKNAAIKTRLMEVQNRSKLQQAQTDKLQISQINAMLRLNKESDGKKFGYPGASSNSDIKKDSEYSPVVLDVDPIEKERDKNGKAD